MLFQSAKAAHMVYQIKQRENEQKMNKIKRLADLLIQSISSQELTSANYTYINDGLKDLILDNLALREEIKGYFEGLGYDLKINESDDGNSEVVLYWN